MTHFSELTTSFSVQSIWIGFLIHYLSILWKANSFEQPQWNNYLSLVWVRLLFHLTTPLIISFEINVITNLVVKNVKFKSYLKKVLHVASYWLHLLILLGTLGQHLFSKKNFLFLKRVFHEGKLQSYYTENINW